MDNDLNTSLAVTALYDVLKSNASEKTKLSLIEDFDRVLSLSLIENAKKHKESIASDAGAADIPAEVSELVEQRKAARKDKNFALADELRAKIAELGYSVEETRQGTVVKPIG